MCNFFLFQQLLATSIFCFNIIFTLKLKKMYLLFLQEKNIRKSTLIFMQVEVEDQSHAKIC